MTTSGHFCRRTRCYMIGGFERAAQEYEQEARDEVRVAVTQHTEMSRAEIRESMRALENQAEQTWTSHQNTKLNEMNGVAGEALENQISSLPNDATAELPSKTKS